MEYIDIYNIIIFRVYINMRKKKYLFFQRFRKFNCIINILSPYKINKYFKSKLFVSLDD